MKYLKVTKLKKKIQSQTSARLINFLEKRKTAISPLLILTHDFPDPDALAASYALQYLAEKGFGIQSRIAYRGIIGRVENRNMVNILNLPAHRLKPWEIKKHDHIALIDTQPCFENNPFPDDRKATIVIDQHPPVKNSKSLSELVIVDETCGATSVILAQAILALNLKIPERLATALAYGILSDTLNLYRAKRPDIIKTYLHILSSANMHSLARIQTPLYEKEYFSILVKGISQAQFRQGLVICHLGRISSPDVVSQMADFLLSYENTKWAFSTGRYKNRLHVSLRTSKANPPAATLLRKCFPNPEDAGGHGRIAGGSLMINPNHEREFAHQEKVLVNNIVKNLRLGKNIKFVHPFKK